MARSELEKSGLEKSGLEKSGLEKPINLVICPGYHDSQWTTDFCQGLLTPWTLTHPSPRLWVVPVPPALPFSPCHLLHWLKTQGLQPTTAPALAFIAFSAGVVGAMAAAQIWHRQGGGVQAFCALDGWGVPVGGGFPIHRLSHDFFTHWSSALLGTGSLNFYADPPVSHADLWQQPQGVGGWACDRRSSPNSSPQYLSAAQFLYQVLSPTVATL
ncbi:hypothetical protein [Prochlorothrix hollandica]|uniref:hypothetical protein n=1 Tax=Prochlorothrix hollandica TaxID=1223 RepID=UPI00034588CA|nr:hypothetical protein [Prochlorothrix hollandica]